MDHLTRGDIFIACFSAVGAVGAVIIGVLVTFHLQNRKDAKAVQEKNDEGTKQLLFRLSEHPLHTHGELTPFAKPTDVLTVEGLRFPRNGNK